MLSVIFEVVLFTAVIMPKFFFELMRCNVFHVISWNIFFVLVEEKCLQITLHPESGKELKNL
jgi:hypothetical protein